jgi:hypothetical protein
VLKRTFADQRSLFDPRGSIIVVLAVFINRGIYDSGLSIPIPLTNLEIFVMTYREVVVTSTWLLRLLPDIVEYWCSGSEITSWRA